VNYLILDELFDCKKRFQKILSNHRNNLAKKGGNKNSMSEFREMIVSNANAFVAGGRIHGI